MSDFPELPETGRENLHRAVRGLPPHEPDAATWPRIAVQLATEQAVAQALPALPAHEPDEVVWTAIASRLDEAATPSATATVVVRPLWPGSTRRVVAGIAASILLALGVWWLRPASPAAPVASAPRETITFGEEEVGASVRLTTAVDPLGQEGKAFIDTHCTSLPVVCQSSEFRELRTQLTEVEAQERRLRQDAQRFGKSPALVRQQVKLTILRAEITRELVQLLIS